MGVRRETRGTVRCSLPVARAKLKILIWTESTALDQGKLCLAMSVEPVCFPRVWKSTGEGSIQSSKGLVRRWSQVFHWRNTREDHMRMMHGSPMLRCKFD